MKELIKFKEALSNCVDVVDKMIEVEKRVEAGEEISEKVIEKINTEMLIAFIKLQILSQQLN